MYAVTSPAFHPNCHRPFFGYSTVLNTAGTPRNEQPPISFTTRSRTLSSYVIPNRDRLPNVDT